MILTYNILNSIISALFRNVYFLFPVSLPIIIQLLSDLYRKEKTHDEDTRAQHKDKTKYEQKLDFENHPETLVTAKYKIFLKVFRRLNINLPAV